MNQKEMLAREALLELFESFRTYVRAGYLEAVPARGEVYVTNSALYQMSGSLEAIEIVEAAEKTLGTKDYDTLYRSTGYDGARFRYAMDEINQNIKRTAKALRDWCWWLNAAREGFKDYMVDVGEKDGALQDASAKVRRTRDIVKDVMRGTVTIIAVEDGGKHDPLLAITVSRVRRWWWPFKKYDQFDIIRFR